MYLPRRQLSALQAEVAAAAALSIEQSAKRVVTCMLHRVGVRVQIGNVERICRDCLLFWEELEFK